MLERVHFAAYLAMQSGRFQARDQSQSQAAIAQFRKDLCDIPRPLSHAVEWLFHALSL